VTRTAIHRPDPIHSLIVWKIRYLPGIPIPKQRLTALYGPTAAPFAQVPDAKIFAAIINN